MVELILKLQLVAIFGKQNWSCGVSQTLCDVHQ